MAVDEAARHRLYNDLVETLGPTSTGTTMELLPPVGWADVATKHDLASLESNLRAEFNGKTESLRADMNALRAEMHAEIGTLRSEFHTTMRTMLFSMIGAMFTLAGLTWAAVTIA